MLERIRKSGASFFKEIVYRSDGKPINFSLMSRNAGSGENGDSGEISSVNLTIFMQITSTEMGLTSWRI